MVADCLMIALLRLSDLFPFRLVILNDSKGAWWWFRICLFDPAVTIFPFGYTSQYLRSNSSLNYDWVHNSSSTQALGVQVKPKANFG